MALYTQIQLNKPLPFPKNHSQVMDKVIFWRASYKTDTDYINSKDAHGEPILMQFPCEGSSEYNYRKSNTKPRGHCGPIIKKQNYFVFKGPIERPEEDVDYQEFTKNCDLAGNTLDEFMQKSLLNAQIDGYSAIVVDHTNQTGETKTLAQARADGDRYFLRHVKRDAVVAMSVNDDILTEIIIIFVDEYGNRFARYYNRTDIQDYQLDDKFNVVGISEMVPHGYTDIPVGLHQPHFDSESQIEPLAELQQGLTQVLSYMAVEIATSIYTLHAFMGELPETDENGKVPNVQLGSNRIVYMSREGKIERIGADTNAASVLQEQIDKTEEAIYRTAGIAAASPFKTGPAQSGLSKIYDLHDLSAILGTLSVSCEMAENKAMDVLFSTMKGLNPADASYDKDFDIPDIMAEITELREVLSLALPDVVKKSHIRIFVSRNYDLNEEEQAKLAEELAITEAPPEEPVPEEE